MGIRLSQIGLGLSLVLATELAGAQSTPSRADRIEDGKFHLRFHFQYFPTDSDIAALRDQVERARTQLCDATDGAVKIGKVTLTVGQTNEEMGDVWVLSGEGRSRSDTLGGHVTLYREGGAYNSATLAHELGHCLLGLGDNYAEDNRAWNGCGMGPSFESSMTTDRDNTIMQDSRALCLLPDGRSLGELNPIWDFKCSGTCDPCLGCSGAEQGVALSCEPSQPLRSELSVAANFDPIHGSGATACPAVKPATGVSVKALFGFDEVPGPPSDLCGNGVVDPGEQCDRNDSTTVLPSCADFGLEPNIDDHVSCFTNCSYNKAACKPPTFDSCSKTSGMPQACDAGGTVPASTSCETLGLGSGFLACFVSVRRTAS
jgi:hypothetical protein